MKWGSICTNATFVAGPAFKPAARRTNKGEENLPLLFWFLGALAFSPEPFHRSVQNCFTAKDAEGAKEHWVGIKAPIGRDVGIG